MDRGDLSFAFTKIAVWRQQRFRKLVYLDSDIIVLRAPDELFDLDTAFAAAPDVGWPDAFNTGVMMLKPDMGEYWALQTMASTGDSFDGADQGLLNQYYQHRNWHRLSFNYNCTLSAQYQWEPAYRYFKNNISIVHFIGRNKPWFQGRQTSKNGPGSYNELLARWWAVYDRHYKAPVRSTASAIGAAAEKYPRQSSSRLVNLRPPLRNRFNDTLLVKQRAPILVITFHHLIFQVREDKHLSRASQLPNKLSLILPN